MLQQDFPLAGCGYGKVNGSFAWLTTPVAGAAGLTVTEAWSRQISLVLQQLINHPSVMRYTLANEFYLNRTANPIEKLFEDTVRALEPTRLARQAGLARSLRWPALCEHAGVARHVWQRGVVKRASNLLLHALCCAKRRMPTAQPFPPLASLALYS